MRRARRLPWARRRLYVEAALELTRASVELRLRHGRHLTRTLGQAVTRPDDDGRIEPVADADEATADVGGVVPRAAQLLPWHPTCLRQALAARRMLGRRGVPAVVHLGVVDATVAEAHAWVTVDRHVVVGGRQQERFTTVASFAEPGTR